MWTFPWTCSGLYTFYDTNKSFKLFYYYYYCIYSFRNFTLHRFYYYYTNGNYIIIFVGLKCRFIGINSIVVT